MENRKYEFTYKQNILGGPQFEVICLEGEEALGRPHRFELTLMSAFNGIDTKKFINKSACLIMHAETRDKSDKLDRHTRYVGVIVEMEKLHSFGEKNFYRALFVSEIWKLSLFKASCFYKTENKNIIDLIEYISNLGYESGEKYLFQTDLVTFRLNRNINNYQPRDFFLQYNESRLNFLQRWMEKEGLYYTITGYEDFKEKLTLYSDVSQLLRPGRQRVTVTYRPIATANTSDVDDSIYKFAQNSKILPKYIKLRDYNYNQASVELTVTQKVSDSGFGELDIFGENYRNLTEGQRYAQYYAEALQCDAFSYHGSGSATGITAGCFIDLLGTEYLVSRVKHTGSQAVAILGAAACAPLGFKVKDGYQCDFEALAITSSSSDSEQQQFRMQRITPKPVVAGNLSALIHKTSHNDKEGYASVEEDGEYFVKFKSIDVVDINSNESTSSSEIKMRLSTPYAGFDHGMHFPLPQGVEVLVGFTNGDPDLPVIMGAVNNSLSPSLSKTSNQTDNIIKTPSGNRITLSDAGDSRGITLAVPNLKENSHYDAVQRISPGDDPKTSDWLEVTLGNRYENLLGNSFSVSAGSSGSVSASLNSSVSLSSSLSLSAGTSTSVNLGSIGVNWTPALFGLNPHRSISLGDGGHSLKFGQDKSVTEINESYGVNIGPLDKDLNQLVFKEKSRKLKAAIGASVVADTIASLALTKGPEIYKNWKVNKIESKYKGEVKRVKDHYQDEIRKIDFLGTKDTEDEKNQKKNNAKSDMEMALEKAAEDRKKDLDKLEEEFCIDDGWGKRSAFTAGRCVTNLSINAGILGSLHEYGKELAEYKKNSKSYRGSFLIDKKEVSINQDLSPASDTTIKNEFLMNSDGIKLSINNKGGTQEFHLSSKDESLIIKHGEYSISLLKDAICLASYDNNVIKHSIVLNKKGIFLDTSEFNVDKGSFEAKKNSVSISKGVLTIKD